MKESRYRLVRPLATGGMAELFLGMVRGAEGFEKPVAIKRILPHLAREPLIAKMFLSEARLATHLHHQNIASVYDVGSGPEGLFLVMELVNGWDLGVLLRHASRRGQQFPPHLVAFIGAQVLTGLVHAYRRVHNNRPVLTAHRDVSPSNILISREGEVKLTDFGIARLEGVSMGTQPGTFKGKLPYSAPETLQGNPATALSDQFSLGIVLYELLAGAHPFGTGLEDQMTLAKAITEQEPAPLANVPPPLAAMVMRAMAKAPEARFPRPEDMAEALARYLAQTGEPASSHSLASFITYLNPPPTLLELEAASTPSVMEANVQHSPPTPEPQPEGNWKEVPDPGARAMPPEHPVLADDVTPLEHWASAGNDQMPSVLDMKEEELELAERPRPRLTESTFVPAEPPRHRQWGPTVAKVATLMLALGAAVMGWPYLQPHLSSLLNARNAKQEMPLLSIQSDPPGATVLVDGMELGTTPLVIDNTYPSQNIPVQVTLKGYKPWKGTLAGNRPVSLDVKLKR